MISSLGCVFICISIIYCLFVILISIGWFTLPFFRKNDSNGFKTSVCVIIALRNEEQSIEMLIKCLNNQTYPDDLLEIILVDDHSTDTTFEKINNVIGGLHKKHNFRVMQMNKEDGFGKKHALHKGIMHSNSELIITTDADCTFGVKWIETIVSYYEKHLPKLILAPVKMSSENSFFGMLQKSDFMSLMATTAGAANLRFPILANGANIAYQRQVYFECNGFEKNIKYASGDDMFMMIAAKKRYGAKAIKFLKNYDSYTETPATIDFNKFINQRIRWISKSKAFRDFSIIASATIIFLINLSIALSLMISAFEISFLKYLVLIFLMRTLIEMPILLSFSKFQKSEKVVLLSPILTFINSLYIPIIGVIGSLTSFSWKGRVLKK